MIEQLLTQDNPYRLEKERKASILLQELNQLTYFHSENCHPYQQILYKTNTDRSASILEEVPFLPVQLFKMLPLYSIPQEEHFKVLTSSGTTGQQVSQIYIDRTTAQLQSRALNVIVRDFLGTQRLPMIIIDTDIMKNRTNFSARTAGTIGFSQFGRNHMYLFDSEMNINWEQLGLFLQRHEGQPKLLFGFTFIIWEYLLQASRRSGKRIDLSGSVLIHGGGWKKLQEQAVDNGTFKRLLYEHFGISRIYNYYGMVEQVGSIFMECDEGYLHTPDFADVLIRNPETLKPVSFGETGLIQVLSVLPKSYPGHSLLTEDVGVMVGEDNCTCGRRGKYFHVHGRIPKAEPRGCSDTFSKI
ncbi:acyl-protein synthetase [Brevibacillus borstelensis]|uniref:LuxE/PaaK family acyltransferase n=1 Tax=Brevibacillus borstelensis TaxID=45462 RepID=UPI00203E5E64|nr:acyl-protein synthetase [Brevibacillus borstelensis]MCM3590192.1 acyl-protein synthetase [Brevibacillus borstelensis]